MRSALNEYPLFQGISEEDQKTLLPCVNARFVQMRAGQTISWQPEHAGLVLDGIVCLAAGSDRATELSTDDLVLSDAPADLTASRDSLLLKMDRQMVNYPCWFSCSFHHRLRQNQEDWLVRS